MALAPSHLPALFVEYLPHLRLNCVKVQPITPCSTGLVTHQRRQVEEGEMQLEAEPVHSEPSTGLPNHTCDKGVVFGDSHPLSWAQVGLEAHRPDAVLLLQ